MVLGRSIGLTDEHMSHLLDDELPEGLFTPDEEAIIRFAQASARMHPISDEIWSGLRKHFDHQQIIELVFIVGMDQLVSRFHALVRTDLDESTSEQVNPATCRVRLPTVPEATRPT